MKHKFKLNQAVYCMGFVKAHKGKHFVCKACITQLPATDRAIYKLRIHAVADSPVGGSFVLEQASLLGKTITKHENEIHESLNDFLAPKRWIELLPHL